RCDRGSEPGERCTDASRAPLPRRPGPRAPVPRRRMALRSVLGIQRLGHAEVPASLSMRAGAGTLEGRWAQVIARARCRSGTSATGVVEIGVTRGGGTGVGVRLERALLRPP